MSLPRLGARDRRALLLGAAVLAPALLFVLGVQPYFNALTSTRDQLAAQRSLLGRELALLADAKHYPALLDRAESTVRMEAPRLFAGMDEVTATARLAGYVSEQARRSRLLLQQSESRAAEPAGEGILALQLDVRAVGDLEGILSMLRALEGGEKLVRVERLSIERVERLGSGEALALSATIRGYMWPRSAATGTDPPHTAPRVGGRP